MKLMTKKFCEAMKRYYRNRNDTRKEWESNTKERLFKQMWAVKLGDHGSMWGPFRTRKEAIDHEVRRLGVTWPEVQRRGFKICKINIMAADASEGE